MKNTVNNILGKLKEFVKGHKALSIVLAVILCTIIAVLIAVMVRKPIEETGQDATKEERPILTEGITRKEWAVKFAEQFGHTNSQVSDPYFSDVTSECEYFVHVQSLAEQEIILIEDKFQPDLILSGNEMLTEVGQGFGKNHVSRSLEKEELTADDYIAYLIELEPELETYAIDEGLTAEQADAMLSLAHTVYINLSYDNYSDMDLKEDVLDLSESTYTVSGNSYSITSKEEIKVGDIVLLASSDADPDGEAIRVEKVEVKNGVYTVSGSTPELEEVFDEFELEFSQIATATDFTPAEGIEVVENLQDGGMYLVWDGTTLDGGNAFADGRLEITEDLAGVLVADKTVNYSDDVVLSKKFKWGKESDLEYTKEYLEYADAIAAAQSGIEPSYLVSKEKVVGKYSGGYEAEVGLSITNLVINGSAAYKFPNKVAFNVNAGVTITPEVALRGNATMNYKIGTYTITVPHTLGAVQLKVDVYCQIGINGEMTVKTTIRTSTSVSKAAGSNHISASSTVDTYTEFDADCEVEILVGPDVTIKLFGIEVADAYVLVGVGACTNYTTQTPNVLTISVYLPLIRAGVGMNDNAFLTKTLHVEKDINIMDRAEDNPLFNCLYRKDFPIEVYDIAEVELPEEEETEVETPTQEEETPQQPQASNFSYVIENGVLTVSGTGQVNGFNPDAGGDQLWMDRREEITKIVVQDGITSIGWYAFAHLENVREVVIADSVTYIGEGAFYECYGIERVKFPSRLTGMGMMAFHCCENLRTVELPEGLTVIPDDAFSYCASLTTVTLSPRTTAIGDYAFESCTALTTINIPEGATIGVDAFLDCTSLINVPGAA